MNLSAPSRFKRYLTVVLRWLMITFGVFALTVFIGEYITDHFVPKVYTATAQIQLRPREVNWLGSHSDGMEDPAKVQAEFIKAQFTLMQSPDFLLPIIHDLGLDKAWATRVFKSKEGQLSDQDALAYMHKILKLDYVRGTILINITTSSDVPQEAADIANAIADRYKTMRDVEEDQRENRGEDSLREQIAQQQKVVDEAKAALEKIADHHSPAYQAAQRDLEDQQSLLDALNVHLKQVKADSALRESPVRIISRAEIPEYPSKPNKAVDLIITICVAGLLSIMAASFVEIIFLFSRASTRSDN